MTTVFQECICLDTRPYGATWRTPCSYSTVDRRIVVCGQKGAVGGCREEKKAVGDRREERRTQASSERRETREMSWAEQCCTPNK